MRKQIYKKAYWLLLPFLPLALANTFLVKEDSKNVTAYTPFATPITDSKSDLVSLAQLDSSYQIADQTIHNTNLFVLFKSRDVKVKYESSGSNNISFDSTSQGEKPSYVVEFTNSTNIGIKWSVVKKYQLDLPNVTNEMNQVLQELILEQPLTKYTLNSSLAKQKGKTQREVHLGSGQANQWTSQRNQHDLNNNPSPNASTGFKLTTGNAYRKLSESWPIYEPIDGTKQGKGKDSSGWSSTEENEAKNDAPSVSGGGSSSGTFNKYLNTKQALESIGILFDDQTPRNVITQLYYASTSKLAVTNNHIVVMGNSFLPSMWYWVVERSAQENASNKPTWFANTNLDWGEDKQKQFVENQLGYKETTSTNSHNFHSKSFTQPAYLISGIDSVNDQIIFSGFKAGSVGYDSSSSSSSSSTKDQALAWSTTTSLDSKTGYKDLVTNDTGLNGPINGSFSIQDTFSFVVPYSGNHTNNGTTGPIKTAYPVKKDQKSTVKINSLINATPLNSYGDEGIGVFDALGLNYNFKSNQERLPSRTDQIFVYGIVSPNELRSAKSSADSTGSDTKVNWSNTQSRYLPVPYNYSEGIIDADGFKRPENRGASVTTFSGLKSIAPDGFANSIANFSVGLKAGIDPNPVMSGKKANYGAVVLTRGGVVRLNFNPGNDSLLSTTDNNIAPISFSFTPFTAAESAVDLTTFKEVTYNQESGLWSYIFDSSLKPSHDGKQTPVTDNMGFSVITVSRTGIELNQDQATTTLDVAPSALAVQSGIQSTTQTLTGVLPLSEEFSAVIAKDSDQNKIDIYKNNNGLFEIDTQLSNSVATNNGGLAPSYTENRVDAWGKVEFADNSVLQARNLVDKTVDEIINTPEILNSFFRFTPAFEDQKATLVATKQSDTSLSVSPRIQFLDGNFYDLNSTIAGVPLNIGFPSRVFAGFAALPAWVIPVSVGSSVGILFILLVLGLGIGIPMYRVRKLQDASFVNVFKKVDTLTTAVGSVYKKIITQTGVVKKAPSALKAANPSVKKPAAFLKPPVQPPSKPEGEQKAVEVKSEETKS